MAIVGDRFCRGDQQVELIYEDHNFSSDKVRDARGNIVFKIRHSPLGGEFTMEDATSDSLLLLLDKKVFSLHGIWTARDAHNRFLFTVRKASMLLSDLNVFVGLEDVNRAPDYIVREKTFSRNFCIVRGHNESLVARMEFPHIFTPDFNITVCPGVDFALTLAASSIEEDALEAQQTAAEAAPNSRQQFHNPFTSFLQQRRVTFRNESSEIIGAYEKHRHVWGRRLFTVQKNDQVDIPPNLITPGMTFIHMEIVLGTEGYNQVNPPMKIDSEELLKADKIIVRGAGVNLKLEIVNST